METERDWISVLDEAIDHLWNYREDYEAWKEEGGDGNYDEKLRKCIGELQRIKHTLMDKRRKKFDTLV